MKPTQSSPNAKKRIVIWLIIVVTASLVVWLLCELGFPLAPMLDRMLIVP